MSNSSFYGQSGAESSESNASSSSSPSTSTSNSSFYAISGASPEETDAIESSVNSAAAYATQAANDASSVASTLAEAEEQFQGALLKANNLSGLSNAATARTNMGLGTAAITDADDYLSSDATLEGGNF